MKKSVLSLVGALFLLMGASAAFGDHHGGGSDIAPKSVIHVVTLTWKEDATDDQIKKALNGVKTIAKKYDGVSRVWTRAIKTQGDHGHAFVMEFKSEKALKDYAGSAAQKEWYELYLPIRQRSTTFDITN